MVQNHRFVLAKDELAFCLNVQLQDLEAIGVKDGGIAPHLEKAAKKLPMFVLEKGIPVSTLHNHCK